MHKNSFNPKTLNANWYEERCTEDFEKFNFTTNAYLKNPSHNKYIPMSKSIGNNDVYQKQKFCDSSENWLNFQAKFTPDETFKTTHKKDYTEIE